MGRDGKVLAFEPAPLVRLYAFYMDGAPLFGFETTDDERAALATVSDGLKLPPGHRYEVQEAVTMPTADLERLKLMIELKTALFNVGQIAEALRAAKSGIALARPGDGIGRPH
jgi:hypothetical protein